MSDSRDGRKRSSRCSCRKDPFRNLPHDLQPAAKKTTSLRKVTCPGCGLVYRTNRATDLCMECENKHQ